MNVPAGANLPVEREQNLVPRRTFWISIAAAATGSASAGFVAGAVLGVHTGLTQPVATVLAGSGALTAGLLAYINGERSRGLTAAHHRADTARERERHNADSLRVREAALRERYTAVAAQIADDSAAIRQAGVYALAALADDWHAFGEDEERQVCINLLQWCLRVPLELNHPAATSEREIRQTIVAMLASRRHRLDDDAKSWRRADINLRQASLSRCVLRSGDRQLIHGYVSGIRLEGLDLTEIQLGDADLVSAELAVALLPRANLVGANLTHADLTGANLEWANMTLATLQSATLTDAKLQHATLSEANLVSANLNGASAKEATFKDARMIKVSACSADLDDADMSGARLCRADFHDSSLAGVDLTGADLTGADLTSANLIAANLTGTNLTGVDLSMTGLLGITFDETTVWPDGYTPR
ncbi:pentapeptide repeat-containing protein [Nocardia heshunensis]